MRASGAKNNTVEIHVNAAKMLLQKHAKSRILAAL